MAVSNDDVMMNNVAHAERIVGDECRICLKSCTEICQLFRDSRIPEKLMAIAAVQVEEGDGLPACICLSCNRLLDISYDFKCQIQEADMKLRQILKSQDLHDEHAKDDTTIVKHIITNLSDVASCEKDNHVMGQKIYTHHDIVSFDSTTIQSDAIINNESCIHNEFLEKTEEITEPNGKDTQYDMLKESVHNTEIALCDETHMDDSFTDQSNRLSDSITDDRCIKQEHLILSEETPGSLADENGEDALKMEIKNDVSMEDFNNHDVPKETTMLEMEPQNPTKNMNCSDDEEKPLISRTARHFRCSLCSTSFSTKMSLQRHMLVHKHKHKHKTKLRYVCHVCDKQFSSISKLKSHVLNSHESYTVDDKMTQAANEDKKVKTSAKVTRSGNVLDGTKEEKKNFKFTCKVCSKQFIYQKSFVSHAKSHPEYNEETSTDAFDQCANKTTSEQKERTPTIRENDSEEEEEEEDDDDDDTNLPIKSLQCTQCGKVFATKRNLKRHISTHSGLKFNCSTCGKGFSRVDKLKDHEQSKHKEEIFGNTDDEDDDDEDNENKVNENSESRKKDRHNRPHKCALCPKAFAQAQSLANHVERHKRVKDTQKRFLCEKCSKCFAQSGSLVAHMRTHTGVKPYVCDTCKRAFTKSTYLQLHLRTHSGEKPYICQYCSRAFARANTLARHITMHTGEAKYHCNVCTKSFRRLTSLNEHTYTHTGQRPYVCKLCTKSYNNAGSLYAHTKKCKAQQLSNSTTAAFAVTVPDNTLQQNNDAPMPQLLIYSQRKLVEEATVGQVVPTPQYMVANVHNQKTVPANVIQPFAVEDPSVYNSKQFKNPYYAIYPNM
ncbi:zinc finger protein 37 homolog [Nylanderia fulva]|uniref:zinc finger protein 37 homolog n=1 Tax=Nylanderia fulva TaxID=613905 RepID=UPI0010FB33F6|nr:zinc finger protein 37 homolog [Nylanderia fulva]